ncbi:hypothetical protein GGI43DRAFT_427727 [Trichoderma evansii]
MATTESGVVRVYRDIEGNERKAQDLFQSIVGMRRRVIDLDEKIYAIRPDMRQLSLAELFMVRFLNIIMMVLNRMIDVTDEAIKELQRWPKRRLTLQTYLDACHSLDIAMSAQDLLVSAPEVRAHGNIQPKLYPGYIAPSPDFATKQLGIWNKLAGNAALRTEACYPSIEDLEWLREELDNRPVGCQWSLFKFMRSAVDEAVDKIMGRIAQNERLVHKFEIGDFIQPGFEPYIVTTRTPIDNGLSTLFAYRRTDSRRVPLLVTSYRPPHRLSLCEILKGLQEGIHVDQDVIGRIGNDLVFTSKCLVTAVITQLFHRMLEVGTQFGYISTGEALIFVEIPGDPKYVYYSLCVPRQDVEVDVVTGLHRTAVAQVLAFTLRALTANPASPAWYTMAQSFERWSVHPDNVFNRIPPLLRKKKCSIQYAPQSWRPLVERSPIRKRVSEMVWPGSKCRLNEADLNDFSVFKFLSIYKINPEGERIDQRPFCSQRCLLGLARGEALDEECPNFRYHGGNHMSRAEFLRLLQTQLEVDVEKEDYTNCQTICRSGLYTALFKVRLASHGYTLLIKGVVRFKVSYLRHEVDMYDQMKDLQGVYVPVCLGMIQTPDPITRYHGDYASFMVLGGLPDGLMPLLQCVSGGIDKGEIVDAVATAFEEIHKLRVLQFDPEPRNMLYDAKGKRAMIADFERAVFDTFEGQQVLDMSVMRAGAETQHAVRERISDECFAQEREYVRERVVEFCESDY